MADLKTLDAKKITEKFAEKADQIQQELKKAARDAIDEVRLVAATMKELPPSSSELLTQAVVARVAEMDFKLSGETMAGTLRGVPAPIAITDVRVCLSGGGWGDHSLSGKDEVQPGKYRALFFLVPVKK